MNNRITVDIVVHSIIVDVFYLFLWDVNMDVIDLPFITNEFKCVSSTIKFIAIFFLYYRILVDICVAYFKRYSYFSEFMNIRIPQIQEV